MELRLEWRDRRVGSKQTPRRFLDYVLDGVSLYEANGMDFISSLGWLPPDEDERAARRLLGREEADLEGRVALYICAECGDLYCGAITAEIERKGDEIVWRGMGLSSIDWWTDGSWGHDQDGFEEWQELRFPARAYEEAIVRRPAPLTRSGPT